ncbi:MAG: tRNA pseudouridine(38-40) synthase TruA [Thermodesulfovibrionales bacterium]|jgi:tRNA pseudouridine38-40 synthase
MRNIRLTLQYDGTNYHGWQTQPSKLRTQKSEVRKIITLQQTIQDVIKKITGEEVNLIASGRTDAGVHAIAQTASFRTESALEPQVIERALNALLPPDIRITDAGEATPDFHPRYDARGKSYVYLLSTERTISPFLCRYVWRISADLDGEGMLSCLDHFTGRHDFTSFRASGCGAKTPVRTISSLTMERLREMVFLGFGIKGEFFRFRVEGDAFLRHMVRNIVGTIVDVGRGKLKPEAVKEILELKDRSRAGATAPARGLFMERVQY